jgi:hypothetical protein
MRYYGRRDDEIENMPLPKAKALLNQLPGLLRNEAQLLAAAMMGAKL